MRQFDTMEMLDIPLSPTGNIAIIFPHGPKSKLNFLIFFFFLGVLLGYHHMIIAKIIIILNQERLCDLGQAVSGAMCLSLLLQHNILTHTASAGVSG